MATVIYNGPYQYRSDNFDLSLLDEAVRYEQSPTTFSAVTISSGKYWIELQGTDFTYSPSGLPVSGMVTGFTSIDKGGANIMLTGLNAAVSKFVTATATGRSPDDDLKLYKSILSGNDIIRGNRSGDQIEGFSGNDTLIGGGSSDILWGGKGAD